MSKAGSDNQFFCPHCFTRQINREASIILGLDLQLHLKTVNKHLTEIGPTNLTTSRIMIHKSSQAT